MKGNKTASRRSVGLSIVGNRQQGHEHLFGVWQNFVRESTKGRLGDFGLSPEKKTLGHPNW